ncbi:MAG TPA: LuxR C-terminal-related transcriptional regulator [Gaiellaceae bacterium]|jgi:LuxR family maltose regulon positive regulatory protein|nr:LuxR C-terminal-related transcriptional regulator [Gaiellaceae bacterium]
MLDESRARIILLCAPAGYGKTTLAREWIATRSEPVAWYRGGAEMSDVAAVALGLAEALAPVTQRDLADRVAALAARNPHPAALGRSLAAALSNAQNLTLAIDDYHFALPSSDSETLISSLVINSELRVLLTSRVRPAWFTPQMSVYGEALLIGQADLAFTESEATEVMGTPGYPGDTEILADSRGWPAVIGLAVFSKDAGTDLARNTLPAELYEYFAEALFKDASPALQQALFALALSGEHPKVFAQVVGPDSERLLSEASARGFTNKTADGQLGLHPLLRTFLLRKFRETTAPESSLVTSTVEALGRGRLWDECLAVLIEFPVAQQVAGILENCLGELLASGRVATLRRWITLASELGCTDPVFALAEAEISLRDGDESRAQSLAEHAGVRLSNAELGARAFVVAARAAHLRGENSQTKDCVQTAKDLAPSEDIRIDATWLEFLTALEEQDPAIHDIAAGLRGASDQSAEHALRLQTAEAFIQIEIIGDVRQAERGMALAPGLLERVYDPLVRTTFMNIWSSCALCLAEYATALERAERQISDARSTGLEFAADHALATKAGALLGLRRIGQARRILQQLESRVGGESGHLAGQVLLKMARLKVASGDVDRAEIMLRREPPYGLSKAFQGEWLGTRAVLLAALGKVHDADIAMKGAWQSSANGDARHLADLAWIILSLRSQSDEIDQSRAYLLHVLQQGHLDDVVFASRAYPALARLGAEDSQMRSELTRIFANSRDIGLGRAVGLEMPRELRRKQGLTPRELEVFELLAQGRSNRSIAETLFISESTAKLHVRHIFEKLGVHSRAEAVAVGDDSTRPSP